MANPRCLLYVEEPVLTMDGLATLVPDRRGSWSPLRSGRKHLAAYFDDNPTFAALSADVWLRLRYDVKWNSSMAWVLRVR